jgi:hypothetical protein
MRIHRHLADVALAFVLAGHAVAAIVVEVSAGDDTGNSSASETFGPPATAARGIARGSSATVGPGTGLFGCGSGCGILPGAITATDVDTDGMRWRVSAHAYDMTAGASAGFAVYDTLLTSRLPPAPVTLDFEVRVELGSVQANRGMGSHAGAEYLFEIGRWGRIGDEGSDYGLVETYFSLFAKEEDLAPYGQARTFSALVFGRDPIIASDFGPVFEASLSVPWNHLPLFSGDLELAIVGGAGAFTEGMGGHAAVVSVNSAYVGITVGGAPVESANGYRYAGLVASAVPEPSTAWLLLGGALGLRRLRRSP